MVRKKIWSLKRTKINQVSELANQLKVSPILASLLINRGYHDAIKANDFLNPSLESLESSFEINGLSEAVEKIKEALIQNKKIMIYGDYDVDGITSTALLILVFKSLGVDVDFYIPDRVSEGYGLNKGAIKTFVQSGYQLVITVDCGISSFEEVVEGQALGLEFIITDHHQPPEDLPPCILINPALENDAPWRHLAGVGVSYKLAQGLLESIKGKETGRKEALKYLDLVALGTIADIVPLILENRILVKYGLEQIVQGKRLGICALCEVADIKLENISSVQVGYMLAPRLNACGRMGDASLGVKLLLSKDENEARQIAEKLNKANQNRQSLEAQIYHEALQMVEEFKLNQDKVIVLASPGWHPGIIGIVASRLVDKYYRPTIVLTEQNGLYQGSGRSIPGLHLYQALNQCQELLESFGGHSQAAGLSLKKENLFKFKDELNLIIGEVINKEELVPTLELDGEIDLRDVDFNLWNELKKLEPFGPFNPEPLLVYRGGMIENYRKVGSEGDHLKLKVKALDTYWDAIGFNMASYGEMAAMREPLDLAFALDENYWKGKTTLQLILKDLKPYYQLDNPYNVTGSLKQENLQIIDSRGCNDKIGYIKKILLSGELTLVYVNSREMAYSLALDLQKYGPYLHDKIGYYHAGLLREERQRIVNLFRTGALHLIVTTNAWGEITDVPDIENIVFYHLCFSKEEYNMLVGRTKSDPLVKIHLLYGKKDKELNQLLLNEQAPNRDELAEFYLLLKKMSSKKPQITYTDKVIVEGAQTYGLPLLQEKNVIHWLGILEELGLLKQEIRNNVRIITLVPNPQKVKLEQSALYLGGIRKKLIFQEYLKTAFDVIQSNSN